MSGPSESAIPAARRAALPMLLIVGAVLATALHRAGHTQGDDFALYLRQARSIFDGDSAAVVADNRFAVLSSDPKFSPIAYPWGWPLLLSPFVHFWGFDYDRLKLVEVALFCAWLTFLHGVVRRRIGFGAALAVVAVFATAPEFLSHTDQLITEIPHLAAVGLFLWWLDRIHDRSTLVAASTGQLLVLGGLAAFTFNIRREGLVLVAVVGALQLYDLVRNERPESTDDAEHGEPMPRLRPAREIWQSLLETWDRLALPHLAFVGAVVLFQLLLPTALLPDNGNSTSNFGDRFSEYPTILSDQLGLGDRAAIGGIVLVIAAVGAVIGVRRRPRFDGAILVLAVLSSFLISTHIRKVERYWFQVTPWVVYFAVVACIALAHLVVRRRKQVATLLALAPLAALVVGHSLILPGDISAVAKFNDAGRVQIGPANPTVVPIYEAVDKLTPSDAVIAFFRARTMTLLTDRRSFQTKDVEKIRRSADFFAQKREGTYWQPDVEAAQLAGFDEVWSDSVWILWRVTDAGTDSETEAAP